MRSVSLECSRLGELEDNWRSSEVAQEPDEFKYVPVRHHHFYQYSVYDLGLSLTGVSYYDCVPMEP